MRRLGQGLRPASSDGRGRLPLGASTGRLADPGLGFDDRALALELRQRVLSGSDGLEPPVDGVGRHRIVPLDLAHELQRRPVLGVQLRGPFQRLLRSLGLIAPKVRLPQEPVGRSEGWLATERGQHLDPDFVVAIQGQERDPEQQAHLDRVGLGQQRTPASADGFLIAPLGDQLLRARGVGIGCHSTQG
jgi:hypothetical protein